MAGRRLGESLFPVHAHPTGQMCVQIDQSGQQRRVTQIDHLRPRRDAEIGPDLGNLFAFHPHHRRSHRRAATSIHKMSGLDDCHGRRGRLCVRDSAAFAQGRRVRERPIGTLKKKTPLVSSNGTRCKAQTMKLSLSFARQAGMSSTFPILWRLSR